MIGHGHEKWTTLILRQNIPKIRTHTYDSSSIRRDTNSASRWAGRFTNDAVECARQLLKSNLDALQTRPIVDRIDLGAKRSDWGTELVLQVGERGPLGPEQFLDAFGQTVERPTHGTYLRGARGLNPNGHVTAAKSVGGVGQSIDTSYHGTTESVVQ